MPVTRFRSNDEDDGEDDDEDDVEGFQVVDECTSHRDLTFLVPRRYFSRLAKVWVSRSD